MLSKSNQWIVLTVIAMATSALIGCNKGGGGGGPAIDCRLAQNFNNATCLNASRGNSIYGVRGPIGAGGYRMTLPPDGIAIITNPNLAFFAALCTSGGAPRVADDRVSRSRTGWGGGDVDDRAYYQDAAYYQGAVCMNIGTVVLSFSAEETSGRNGRQSWIGWKFYFVPVGIPVPPGSNIQQIQALSQRSSSRQFDDFNIRKGPHQFGARTSQGIGLDFVKNGDVITVNVLGPQGPVGTGSMTPQSF